MNTRTHPHKVSRLLIISAVLLGVMASGCGSTATPATITVSPTNASTNTPIPPSRTPAPTQTATLAPTMTPTSIPLTPLVLTNQNMTLTMPPGWKDLGEIGGTHGLSKTDTSITMMVMRETEKSPTDLIDHGKGLAAALASQFGLKGKIETMESKSLALADGREVRVAMYAFPEGAVSNSGQSKGSGNMLYYYVHDGVSGYTFIVVGGKDDLEPAKEEIEGIVTSAVCRVAFDNVHLNMAMLPDWKLFQSADDALYLGVLDANDNALASLLINTSEGMPADAIAGNSPEVVAVASTFFAQQIWGFNGDFKADRTVKLANGVEAMSAYATGYIKGVQTKQEFWFINIPTTHQNTWLMFNAPAGYREKNKATLDAFLTSIELTAR